MVQPKPKRMPQSAATCTSRWLRHAVELFLIGELLTGPGSGSPHAASCGGVAAATSGDGKPLPALAGWHLTGMIEQARLAACTSKGAYRWTSFTFHEANGDKRRPDLIQKRNDRLGLRLGKAERAGAGRRRGVDSRLRRTGALLHWCHVVEGDKIGRALAKHSAVGIAVGKLFYGA